MTLPTRKRGTSAVKNLLLEKQTKLNLNRFTISSKLQTQDTYVDRFVTVVCKPAGVPLTQCEIHQNNVILTEEVNYGLQSDLKQPEKCVPI